MKLGPTVLAAAFLPLLALGCRDTSEVGGPVTVSRFIEMRDSARKAKLTECFPAFSREFWKGPSYLAPAVYEKGVAAGRLVFHEERVETCIQAMLKQSCDLFLSGSLAACNQVFEPLVAPGGECYSSEECVGGWCPLDGCPKACVAYAQLGESCAGPRCDPATGYCDPSDKTCHPRKADGACDNFDWCLEGLLCDGDNCVAPDSIPSARLGEKCGTCAYGLYCASLAAGLLGGECKALPEPEEGTACDLETLCGEGMVCAGAGPESRCLSWAELGEPCVDVDSSSSGMTGCKLGLKCVEGRCELPPVVGPCESQSSCRVSVSYCSDEGQCVPLKAVGESCSGYWECASGRCDGTCIGECTP